MSSLVEKKAEGGFFDGIWAYGCGVHGHKNFFIKRLAETAVFRYNIGDKDIIRKDTVPC
jgi:hypothetical protein